MYVTLVLKPDVPLHPPLVTFRSQPINSIRSVCEQVMPRSPGQTVYSYFCPWSKDETWVVIHDRLRAWVRVVQGRALSLLLRDR